MIWFGKFQHDKQIKQSTFLHKYICQYISPKGSCSLYILHVHMGVIIHVLLCIKYKFSLNNSQSFRLLLVANSLYINCVHRFQLLLFSFWFQKNLRSLFIYLLLKFQLVMRWLFGFVKPLVLIIFIKNLDPIGFKTKSSSISLTHNYIFKNKK
jgi:hypothetical protein